VTETASADTAGADKKQAMIEERIEHLMKRIRFTDVPAVGAVPSDTPTTSSTDGGGGVLSKRRIE
jgi:transcription elongation GreA/GreB family factor